jgi:hypothetical protein
MEYTKNVPRNVGYGDSFSFMQSVNFVSFSPQHVTSSESALIGPQIVCLGTNVRRKTF